MNESSPDNVNYEDQSAYDVADMVKQFFRDLPEPLLTSKLGETFLHIYQCKDRNLTLFLFDQFQSIFSCSLGFVLFGEQCKMHLNLTESVRMQYQIYLMTSDNMSLLYQ